jgi:hypothetical protein
MNAAPMPPRAVPTLTEVLAEGELSRELPRPPQAAVPEPVEVEELADAAPAELPAPLEGPETPHTQAVPVAAPAFDLEAAEARITQQVLLDVQRQVDLMLEYRLREALAPALARVCDLLIREARTELSATLRDVVARAVAQELARQRAR